jgi:ribosomal protein L32
LYLYTFELILSCAMAVPKKRQTSAKQRRRRRNHAVSTKGLKKTKAGALTRSHRVGSDGTYKGRDYSKFVVEVQ